MIFGLKLIHHFFSFILFYICDLAYFYLFYKRYEQFFEGDGYKKRGRDYPSPSIIPVTSSNNIARDVLKLDVPMEVDFFVEEVDIEKICDGIKMVIHVYKVHTREVPRNFEKKDDA